MKAKTAWATASIFLVAIIPVCYGQASDPSSSMSDRFNSAFEKAAKATGVIKEYGHPRKVEKGAQPAIVLKGNSIYFNTQQLKLGSNMDGWRKVIGKGSICSPKNARPTRCKWDTLGLEITATFERPQLVSQMRLHFSRDATEDLYDIRPRDAMGKPIDPVWLSKGVFPGYLGLYELTPIGYDARYFFCNSTGNPRAAITTNNLHIDMSNCYGASDDTLTLSCLTKARRAASA